MHSTTNKKRRIPSRATRQTVTPAATTLEGRVAELLLDALGAKKKQPLEFKPGGWTRRLSGEEAEAVRTGIQEVEAAINVGDFALAHRILVVLEIAATGKSPDVSTLCRPRGYTHFATPPGRLDAAAE